MKKLSNIQFIRAVAALGIIIFHFAGETGFTDSYVYYYANGGWGSLFVTIFFVLSGGVLTINNMEVPSLKKFYIKRFKAIYPSFWIAFLVFYLKSVIREGSFFYLGHPARLLLSIAGLDGYLSYLGTNYYILGEWFLGGLILLYLLYPFVVKAMNKNTALTTIVITILFAILVHHNYFEIPKFRNPISCLFSFYFGMLLFKYRKILENKWTLIVSLIVTVILTFYKIPCKRCLTQHIYGFAMFIVLYHLGKWVMSYKPCEKIFNFLAGISYQIFLLQHVIILSVVKRFMPATPSQFVIVLLLDIAITVLLAWILKYIVGKRPFRDSP